MPTYFSDKPTNPRRALQIWQILITAAMQRQVLTYGGLANRLGIGVAVALTAPLGHIMRYCEQHGLPALTVIVVNGSTGKPGQGIQLADIDREREVVFGYNWYDVYPPTEEELRQAYQGA